MEGGPVTFQNLDQSLHHEPVHRRGGLTFLQLVPQAVEEVERADLFFLHIFQGVGQGTVADGLPEEEIGGNEQ